MDTDTAYIYDYLNRWKAKALSIVFPFVWAESYPEIGLWFNYEPTSKEKQRPKRAGQINIRYVCRVPHETGSNEKEKRGRRRIDIAG